ncbi:hypothetical protein KXR87_22370 [Yokenella regensburgei]
MRHGVVLAAVLLTGCPGPGDKVVSRVPALVAIKHNAVCVVSPVKPDEKIIGIQFYSSSGEKQVRLFHNQPVYAPPGTCLPLFGYLFMPGQRYTLAYDIETPDPSNYHLVTAEFSVLSTAGGGLRIAPY